MIKVVVFMIGAFLAPFVIAEETAMCSYYYEAVERKVGNLGKKELSTLAKESLLSTVNRDLKDCLQDCEGAKFDYCNDIANMVEEK